MCIRFDEYPTHSLKHINSVPRNSGFEVHEFQAVTRVKSNVMLVSSNREIILQKGSLFTIPLGSRQAMDGSLRRWMEEPSRTRDLELGRYIELESQKMMYSV